jgi:phosphoribosylamine-glycine ligase
MTATYTNRPGVRDIDTVRREIDDRDCDPETDALLSDEEIQYYIDSNSHILLAAAAAAESVAMTFASDGATKQVGDLRIDYGTEGRSASYTTMADKLRKRAYKKAGANIYAGGVSQSDKTAIESDTDRVQPVFTIGMDDPIGSSATETDRGIIDY